MDLHIPCDPWLHGIQVRGRDHHLCEVRPIGMVEEMTRKSTGSYPPNWDEIAKAVKDAADWKCIRCHHAHDIEAGYMLTVHHLDLNPANCAWWNIPALCQRCHLRVQATVIMERPWMFEHSEWFKPYVAAYYATRGGYLPTTQDYHQSLQLVTRELIAERMNEFLMLGVLA
jgi:5-methylcytosine-specific restriction endonuclease McrA